MSDFYSDEFNEDSYNAHGVRTESSLTEGKGREGKGLTTPSQGVTTNLTTTTGNAAAVKRHFPLAWSKALGSKASASLSSRIASSSSSRHRARFESTVSTTA
jgi:hypothetical protein